jgi:photosystem II stability/assembly factor-like uncharacterized protein
MINQTDMKNLAFFSAFAILLSGANAQFVQKPLNFPADSYFTRYHGIIDSNTVWVGATLDTIGGSYSKAIKTTDGGNTWQFYSIPASGTYIIISDVTAFDADTCYYVLYSGAGSSIWKTVNGGSSWTKKTSTQFSGGFANFYHAFSADTGLAGGDPNGGYWEIQKTTDGGNSWARVPSANIPASMSQETGTTPSGYSAAGNRIWFSTNRGRCYRSTDKGLNWSVKQVTNSVAGGIQYCVCFVDSLRGVFWEPMPLSKKSAGGYNSFYTTTDGGLTWSQQTLDVKYEVRDFSRVPGTPGGLVICAYDTSNHGLTTVLFTSDFLSTLAVVQTRLLSDGTSTFTNATTGWLSGPSLQNNDILKFSGNLMEFAVIKETAGGSRQLQVIPNPASSEAILQVPDSFGPSVMILKIFAVTGKMLEERRIASSTKLIRLNASGYTDGIYLIRLSEDSGESSVCKWSIRH